jgi:hypothetical protein
MQKILIKKSAFWFEFQKDEETEAELFFNDDTLWKLESRYLFKSIKHIRNYYKIAEKCQISSFR